MKRTLSLPLLVGGPLLASIVILSTTSAWAAPSLEQALGLVPVQKDVDYDRPTSEEVGRCKMDPLKDRSGWVVSNPAGVALRIFVDTNGDNTVDQWRYYKDGLEVYRDIDSNSNKKADQYRWFHTAGSRWGVDNNEDGVIDAWKVISAEEVSAEVVAALANRDVQRFMRVALTPADLPASGLGQEKSAALVKKISELNAAFQQAAASQKAVSRDTQWVQFSAAQPGVVPSGTDGSTKDLRVYENVMAVVQTGEQTGQVLIGTLVAVGDVWRVMDVPQPITAGESQVAATGFFFRAETPEPSPAATSSGPNAQVQSLLAELQQLDTAADQAGSVEEQARLNAQRADLLEKIASQADQAEDRVMWLRQLADTVSAAVQSGGYPDGAKRLGSLFERLKNNPNDKSLAAYVKFRQLTAEYWRAVQNASMSDFVKIQEAWLGTLEQYANEYPDSPDAAEAMLQLGIAQEFAGEEDQAKKWYSRVVEEFPNSQPAAKAAGARRRLDSVGTTISLRGQDPNGGAVDLARLRGKVVLIQYWATLCGPCKADMATLKDLMAKYGSGLSIIGVNLDNNPQEATGFLAQNPLPWPQICEEGGLDSRLANEMGILTLPTMILVDQQGKVVNRNVQVAELEGELKKLIR